jgi:hypothetical protein
MTEPSRAATHDDVIVQVVSVYCPHAGVAGEGGPRVVFRAQGFGNRTSQPQAACLRPSSVASGGLQQPGRVDRIASCFTEDATFWLARGPEPVGRTLRGAADHPWCFG